MIFNYIRKVRNHCIKSVAIKRFRSSAQVAGDIVFMDGASCRNTGPAENVVIGRHCTIGAAFIALFGGKITVGENTYIGPETSLQSKERITIGNNVIVANNVILLDNNNHPTSSEMRMKMSACQDFINDELWTWKYADSAPITIEDNVWIGRDARILKGVTVGKGSIIALGAVVTRDVPAYSVAAGNPARVVKQLPKPGDNG